MKFEHFPALKLFVFLSFVVFCEMAATSVMAQQTPAVYTDTLRLDLKTAEKLFLDSNLQLLAQHYNIKSNEALVEQARKWDNPQLSTNQNIYNKQEGWFKHNSDPNNPEGEFYGDVEQLIKTAGKRRKQIDLAKTNVNLAEWQFKATMRTLRLTLITDFYTLEQLLGNAQLYNDNMLKLNKLISGMKNELQAGNIARKEYLRVQALMVSLQQNISDNNRSIEDNESELRNLLRLDNEYFVVPVADTEVNAAMPEEGIDELIDSAMQHNTDYQQEVYQVQYQKQYYSLQRALSVPDVTVGVDFDQHATYAPNYFGLNIGLPLPLWDRNQGNIKSACYQVTQEETNLRQADNKLQNDVMAAYKKLLSTVQLNSGTNKQFYKDYYQIYNNVVDAFNNRQISLLEFLDYFNDYENTRENQLQQTLNLRVAQADLNDVVGVDVVR
jgi:outer membrane protein, heavy metal efflux system